MGHMKPTDGLAVWTEVFVIKGGAVISVVREIFKIATVENGWTGHGSLQESYQRELDLPRLWQRSRSRVHETYV